MTKQTGQRPKFSPLAIHAESPATAQTVAEALAPFGEKLLAFAAAFRIRVRVLEKDERFTQASAALSRMQLDVDSWPAPPAGLFVLEERCLYLRSVTKMVVAHEFGHAQLCALGVSRLGHALDGIPHDGQRIGRAHHLRIAILLRRLKRGAPGVPANLFRSTMLEPGGP